MIEMNEDITLADLEEMSEGEIVKRFERLRDEFDFKKYQMADLIGIGENNYQQKTNESSGLSFRRREIVLLYFLEKHGLPEGYTPPVKQPTYARMLDRVD